MSSIKIRLTDEDRATIKAAAEAMRLPVATFMRLAALRMARVQE